MRITPAQLEFLESQLKKLNSLPIGAPWISIRELLGFYMLRYAPEFLSTARRAEELEKMLRKCQLQFKYYEAQHRAKGTADAEAKAAVNGEFAAEIEELLK
jgi:hypothetical protein